MLVVQSYYTIMFMPIIMTNINNFILPMSNLITKFIITITIIITTTLAITLSITITLTITITITQVLFITKGFIRNFNIFKLPLLYSNSLIGSRDRVDEMIIIIQIKFAEENIMMIKVNLIAIILIRNSTVILAIMKSICSNYLIVLLFNITLILVVLNKIITWSILEKDIHFLILYFIMKLNTLLINKLLVFWSQIAFKKVHFIIFILDFVRLIYSLISFTFIL